ncbi:hypothetical protein B0A48_06121 [Cryoendolithus antarcticus]|uniref:Rhodopsin domain-containing protein n=1 Tax=Cryoendolithus antarcticus TaxID=1507870 RepID=A0A1V8TCX0_9PEZI|nr:hypothetical protein B0A48_06121 [Cryoendolithus antarcticus]
MSSPRYTTGWVHNLQTVPKSTNAGHVIALASSFSAIALLSIIIRIATKFKILKGIGTDDVAATLSMVLGLVYSALAIYQTRWGLGLHIEDFPSANPVPFSKIQYVGGPIYCLAVLGFKVSLVASYIRVAGFNRNYKIFLMVVMAMVIANQVIYTILLSFACRPIAKQWDPTIPGVCIDQLATYFGLGGSSLAFDFIIIVLPFPILRRLQLDTRKKIGLGALFALGFFITIVQGLRVRTISRLRVYTDSEPIIEWSIIEINIGVLIACVPSFVPMMRSASVRVQSIQKSYHSRNASTSKRQSKLITPGTSTNRYSKDFDSPKRSSKVLSPPPPALGTLGEDHDEQDLWAKRRGWNEDTYGWSDANAVPMTALEARVRSMDGDGSDRGREIREGIMVSHSVSISRDSSVPP